MKKIAIIGEGYVGNSMKEFFYQHFDLVVVDIKHAVNSTVNHEQYGTQILFTKDYEQANGCDLCVISLPTPCREDGSCNTDLVTNAIRQIDSPMFLIKSTIEPGTTEKMKEETGKRIVFSPEFCGESKYWTEYKFHTDVKETPWFVFGGDENDTKECLEYFIRVAGPTKRYYQTDALTAELTKYVENTFFALKVTFCYEINELCERIGIDYYKMREMWLADPRINPMHTAVFEDSEKPFGGKCFPKDVSALSRFAKNLGYDAKLLEEILNSNDRIGEIRKSKQS